MNNETKTPNRLMQKLVLRIYLVGRQTLKEDDNKSYALKTGLFISFQSQNKELFLRGESQIDIVAYISHFQSVAMP